MNHCFRLAPFFMTGNSSSSSSSSGSRSVCVDLGGEEVAKRGGGGEGLVGRCAPAGPAGGSSRSRR